MVNYSPNRNVLLALFASSALALVGCPDDEAAQPTDVGDLLEDVISDGSDMTDTIADEAADSSDDSSDGGAPTGCDNIVENAEAGVECTGAEGECADGVCIQFTGEDVPTCRQECVPDECEDYCKSWDRCLTVLDGGEPRLREDGRVMGVCGTTPPGDQGSFDRCGGDYGRCQANHLCMSISGSATTQCLPECTGSGDCPEHEGFQSMCALSLQDSIREFCALPCDPENDGTNVGCPEEMVCAGSSSAFCIWPVE